jgi:hypothetical protein
LCGARAASLGMKLNTDMEIVFFVESVRALPKKMNSVLLEKADEKHFTDGKRMLHHRADKQLAFTPYLPRL